MPHKIVNGQQVELTADEIAARQAEEAAWLAAQPSALEVAMKNLRAKRDQDLKDSDHKVLPDSPLTSAQKSAWMTFRTELRDVTEGLNTVEDVNNLDYPDKPTE